MGYIQNMCFFNRETLDRATDQAVSRWLQTVAALIRFQFRLCGICGQSDIADRFSLSTSISPTNLHSTNCSTFINHFAIDVIGSRY
jgi:hypothetical protein